MAGAKIINPEELDDLKLPLPESWRKAAGILRNKKIDPVAYQKRMRRQWGERIKRITGSR